MKTMIILHTSYKSNCHRVKQIKEVNFFFKSKQRVIVLWSCFKMCTSKIILSPEVSHLLSNFLQDAFNILRFILNHRGLEDFRNSCICIRDKQWIKLIKENHNLDLSCYKFCCYSFNYSSQVSNSSSEITLRYPHWGSCHILTFASASSHMWNF